MVLTLNKIYEIYQESVEHNKSSNLQEARVFINKAINGCECLIDATKDNKERSDAIQILKTMKEHERSINELEKKICEVGKLIRSQSGLEPTPIDPLPEQKPSKTSSAMGRSSNRRSDGRGLNTNSSPSSNLPPSNKKGAFPKGKSKPIATRETKAKAASNVASSYDALNKTDEGKGKEGEGDEQNQQSDFLALQSPELLECVKICMKDDEPDTKWKQIFGLDEPKKCLRHAMVISRRYPKLFTGIRRPLKTFLLYGPPGTGKTILAKAIATECKYKFFCVTPSTLSSKWRGDSEKLIRVLFDTAKYFEPSLIFFDELDSIAFKRGCNSEHEATRRTICEFLVQFGKILDDEKSRVYVVAATNRPWDIDEAVLRRFEARFFAPLPDEEAIEKMLRSFMNEIDLADNFPFKDIAKLMVGYTGSDIINICKRASLAPVDEFFETLTQEEIDDFDDSDESKHPKFVTTEEHFRAIIGCTMKTVKQETIEEYIQWGKKHSFY